MFTWQLDLPAPVANSVPSSPTTDVSALTCDDESFVDGNDLPTPDSEWKQFLADDFSQGGETGGGLCVGGASLVDDTLWPGQ
jgi:hypothetical protein